MSLMAHPCPRRARSALGRRRNGGWRDPTWSDHAL